MASSIASDAGPPPSWQELSESVGKIRCQVLSGLRARDTCVSGVITRFFEAHPIYVRQHCAIAVIADGTQGLVSLEDILCCAEGCGVEFSMTCVELLGRLLEWLPCCLGRPEAEITWAVGGNLDGFWPPFHHPNS